MENGRSYSFFSNQTGNDQLEVSNLYADDEKEEELQGLTHSSLPDHWLTSVWFSWSTWAVEVHQSGQTVFRRSKRGRLTCYWCRLRLCNLDEWTRYATSWYLIVGALRWPVSGPRRKIPGEQPELVFLGVSDMHRSRALMHREFSLVPPWTIVNCTTVIAMIHSRDMQARHSTWYMSDKCCIVSLISEDF